MQRWIALVVFLLAELPVGAQYPGSRRPPVPLGIPRTTKPKQAPEEATLNIFGVLRKLNDKELILEAQDTRILTLRRTKKTTFYKDSVEAKSSEFQAGDRLLVEASRDEEGYLYAVAVTLQKAGTAEERASAGQPVEPSLQQPEDEGPPVLRRADSPRKEEPEDTEPAPQPEVPATAPPEPRPQDPLIEQARLAAAALDEKLPNYICRQMTTRYRSFAQPINWKPLDVISADVVYEKGREQYRNIAVNGKATNKKLEQIGGAWSKGEYGSVLADLFAPATDTQFRLRGNGSIAGVDTAVYDFFVELQNSHWSIHVPSQVFRPAYGGSIWIDRKNGRVMRIEIQARRLPEEFPLDTVEASVDYQYVRLGGVTEFLLPVHAEMLSCQRETNACSRNAIDFRNYHKFEGESTIKYEP
jgi:hypothetical protein